MAEALEVLASLVMPSGARWGEVATPVQWEDARAVLAAPEGPRRHWISRARGFSKTDDVAGMTAAVLLCDLVAGEEALGFARGVWHRMVQFVGWASDWWLSRG